MIQIPQDLLDALHPEIRAAVTQTLLRWTDSVPAFEGFLFRFQKSLKAALNERKGIEDQRDVVTELKIAASLLNSGVVIQCYDTRREGQRTPDFQALWNGVEFSAEVKRLRVTPLERDYDRLLNEVYIAAKSVRSRLAISVVAHDEEMCEDFCREFVKKCDPERVREWLVKRINELSITENIAEVTEPVPGLETMLKITFHHRPMEYANCPTGNFGGTYSIKSKPNAHLKIMDALGEKLRQLSPSIVNVLIICNDSELFGPYDCQLGCQELVRNLTHPDADFRDKLRRWKLHRNDAIEAYRRLSVVVFRNELEPVANSVFRVDLHPIQAPDGLVQALRNVGNFTGHQHSQGRSILKTQEIAFHDS